MPYRKSILKQRKNLLEYKKKLSCTKCGIQDHRVMEFHHVKDKKYDIGRMANRGYSWETIKKEIDKCIPLCSNCHRIVHYKE